MRESARERERSRERAREREREKESESERERERESLFTQNTFFHQITLSLLGPMGDEDNIIFHAVPVMKVSQYLLIRFVCQFNSHSPKQVLPSNTILWLSIEKME